MNTSLVVIVGIVGMVTLVIAFSAQQTGLVHYNLCPEGTTSVIRSIPGGGNQVVDCVDVNSPVGGFGNTFDTYGADPRGDLRRQRIAQQGYDTRYS